jgi:hypothetical protein
MPWHIPYELGKFPEFEIPRGALNGYEIAECRLNLNGPEITDAKEIIQLPPHKLVVTGRTHIQFNVRREDGNKDILLFHRCHGNICHCDFDAVLFAPWGMREAATRLLPGVCGSIMLDIANGLSGVAARLTSLAVTAPALPKLGPRRLSKP